MSRDLLDSVTRALESAYRGDRWHALRGNLDSVTADEWDARPEHYSTEVFGTRPALSIADIVEHVGAAKFMYADHAFGAPSRQWGDVVPPARDIPSLLAWLDDGHTEFQSGLATLRDDAELAVDRPAPAGGALPTARPIEIVIHHDVYHAGEINRQRSLIRGAEGWSRTD